jgi:beta-glucosidase/6-phospho-beta-glucosidase/beta-galactosidase
MDFYRRLTEALLEAGIEPFVTLYHWDLPQALQDKGGWENRGTAQAFADYAGYTAGKLSDKVHHFMTMNEMRTFVEHGYGDGEHAPGLQVDAKRLAQLSVSLITSKRPRRFTILRSISKPRVRLCANRTRCSSQSYKKAAIPTCT